MTSFRSGAMLSWILVMPAMLDEKKTAQANQFLWRKREDLARID
jgi:hypothetical protein